MCNMLEQRDNKSPPRALIRRDEMRFDEQGAAHASFIIKPDTLLSNKQFVGQAFPKM
jgi:hypothetical protein